jgi:hypothetical protein
MAQIQTLEQHKSPFAQSQPTHHVKKGKINKRNL